MLKSKYILLIIMLFVGAQLVASQSVCDSVTTDTVAPMRADSLATDTLELADAEFEAWLEEYATVKEHKTDDKAQITDSCTRNTNEKRDFIDLVNEGEEARTREKNALISNVMASLNKKVQNEEPTDKSQATHPTPNPISSQKEQQPDSTISTNSFAEQLKQLSIDEILAEAIVADSMLTEVDSLLATLNPQSTTKTNPLFIDWVLGVEPAVSVRLDDSDSVIVAARKSAKDYVRTTSPELYAYHKSDLPSINELQISHITHADKTKLLLNLDSLNRNKASQLKVDLPEMSKWSKGAKFQVHASQNYISSNWYKGGESNMAMTMYAMGYFNYDNRKGLQWDNKAEWKLGLYGVSSDSLRWLRVNDDLFRLNSKLGYKAFKNFFYTAEWDFQTSLFNTYKSNTYIRSSGPFSPIRMSLSFGMDYKWKNMVSVFISPLSYKLVYVADMNYKDGVLPEENIAHQVGITDGTRQSNQLGALVRTDFDYDFNESIGMEVHFSFFGNYVGKIKGIEVGCEVIGNFKINRFLSAKVSLYPRYDSTTIPADGGKPKMQFYELISLGFNYKL